MSKKMIVMITLAVVVLLALPISAALATTSGTIPSISIVSVVPGAVVTVETYNFPADLDFDVTIGPYGTYGIDGTKVATTNSGKGGTFTATYNIPEELKNSARLSIRLHNPTKGYYAYNWFENTSLAPVAAATSETASTIPGYVGYPSFSITAVEADKSVNVEALNFPPDSEAEVTMNVIGTFGIGGYDVTTQKTGEKGEFTASYKIPEELAGLYMISMRIEDPVSGYYAINWFFNTTHPVKVEATPTVSSTPQPGGTPSVGTGGPVTDEYDGYPRVEISAVEKDVKVTIQAMNLPKNEKFDVYMGSLEAMATGGTKVGAIDPAGQSEVEAIFEIPEELAGLGRISIRIVSDKSGYYGYNWFYNQTYP